MSDEDEARSEFEWFVAEVPRDGQFRPFAAYCPEGDHVEVFLSYEQYHGERTGIPGVTVYRGEESKAVVGVLVEGLKELVAEGMRPRFEPMTEAERKAFIESIFGPASGG